MQHATSNVIAFPIETIVWRAVEAELKAEAERNRNIASGHIRVFPRHENRQRIERTLSHIPLRDLDAAIRKLDPRIKEAVALTNEELYDSVFRRRLNQMRK